jgi:hypothetical protein
LREVSSPSIHHVSFPSFPTVLNEFRLLGEKNQKDAYSQGKFFFGHAWPLKRTHKSWWSPWSKEEKLREKKRTHSFFTILVLTLVSECGSKS